MSESGFFVTPGDRHPVAGAPFLVHLFHYGDWDLRFFPVGWDFQISEIDWRFFLMAVAVCDRLFYAILVQLPGPFFTSFGVFCWLCFAAFCCFCLDEDCIPGWGECGRPLRL